MPILNFTRIQIQIQILFLPEQIQIQIQIPAALHTPKYIYIYSIVYLKVYLCYISNK